MFDFTSIMHTGSFSLQTVLLTMLTALILGVIIALVYRSSHSHTSSFAVVLAVLPVVEAVIIMLVNGNLGTGLVVLGAFGLIRFRSATGSAWDIGFIFFAMAVGLAVGLGFLTLAALLALVVCAVMFVLERLHFGINVPKEKHLRITIPEDLEYSGIFDEPFKTYTNYARLERVKTINLGTMYELTYVVDLKDPAKEKEFIDALRCRNGNLTVIVTSVLRNKDDL
jgi:hypothetical protein